MTERRTHPERRGGDRRAIERRGGTKLQRLSIDFGPRRRSPPWVARVLLVAATAIALDAGLTWHDSQRIIEANRSALAAAQPALSAPRASKEDVEAARDTVQRLAMPWDGLFGALESAATDQVALLAVEPDAKAGKVLISAEGKDYLAALTYVLNLSRSGALSGVQLVRHETRPEDPQRAVAFSVSAQWIGEGRVDDRNAGAGRTEEKR
jgi:hypothetical protein